MIQMTDSASLICHMYFACSLRLGGKFECRCAVQFPNFDWSVSGLALALQADCFLSRVPGLRCRYENEFCLSPNEE
jgi:hypothetical protein